MTFLLQAQKLIMWNAWFLTKLIRDHDSKTSSFSQTTTTLHIQCCRSSLLRVMTSDQPCQEPSILHNTWVHLTRQILSPKTKSVVRDRLCRPWQTLSSTTVTKRQTLLPTTKFVTKDKVCHKIKRQDLSSTTNFVFWETVVRNKLCRWRQTLLSATQIVQNDTFSRFRWTQVICQNDPSAKSSAKIALSGTHHEQHTSIYDQNISKALS